MYTAYYMPSKKNNEWFQSNFKTEEDAWKWIGNNGLCQNCKKELEDKGFYFEEGDEWVEVEHPCNTMCGAEWDVFTTEEFESYKEPEDPTDKYLDIEEPKIRIRANGKK